MSTEAPFASSAAVQAPADSLVLDAAQRALVAELAELMLPATDTPGAAAAGVPAFVERMLAEWCTAGERRLFLANLRELDADALQRYKRRFVDCSTAQKQLLLRLLESAAARVTTSLLDVHDQQRLSFFLLLKQLVVTGFFSSEVGGTQVLRRPPATQAYDGDYVIDAAHPAWS